jgi:spore germination protein YaaH
MAQGVPLYTRVWTETPDGSGGVTLSSKAIGMKDQEGLILGKDPVYLFDDTAGQMTASYKENDAVKRIWLEDETSMKARLQLIKKYQLAGLASWRKGFETESFWAWVRENMKGQ